MKNQYFGDVRDLFKYDLIHWLYKNLEFIDHLTFIPMLTEPDNRGDGQKTDYDKAKAGNKNKGLVSFLGKCVDDGRRDIREIQKYFRNRKIRLSIYRAQEYFTQKNRQEYFEGIDKGLLSRSLVILDPDNGMETAKPNRRHVLYEEIKDIYDRMDNNSILMIYQHFTRMDHDEFLQRRSANLYELLGSLPFYIHDNEVIFFLIAKRERQRISLMKALVRYWGQYGDLNIGNIETGEWNPRTLEDRILHEYWQEKGGVLFLEVPIGNSEKRALWPAGSRVRRIDGVLLPGDKTGRSRKGKKAVIGGEKLSDMFRGRDVELIEVKKKLNRPVFGQVLAGKDMFAKQYKPSSIKPLILYVESDPAMEWVCKKHGISTRQVELT